MKSTFDRDLTVYIDSEFVARKYEETTGSAPALTITKSQDLSTSVSAGLMVANLKADATIRESRTYTASSWQMLSAVWPTLQEYPNFSGELSVRPVWFEGMLGVGGAEHIRTSGKTDREHLGDDTYFVLRTSEDFSIPMLARSQFFSPGYDQILSNIHGERVMIWLHVYLLGKVLFRNPAYDVSMMVPYLIYSGDSLENSLKKEVNVT